MTNLSVHQRTRNGLGRSFQITKIFAGMSVLENLQIAAFAHRYRLQPFWLLKLVVSRRCENRPSACLKRSG